VLHRHPRDIDAHGSRARRSSMTKDEKKAGESAKPLMSVPCIRGVQVRVDPVLNPFAQVDLCMKYFVVREELNVIGEILVHYSVVFDEGM